MENISVESFHPNTSILLEEKFIKELRSNLESEDKVILKQNYKGFRKIGKIIKICKKYNINLKILNCKIVAYRTTRGRVTVIRPKLPIEVNPIFDMLIAHGIGDGFCSHLENRIPALMYRQSKKEILDLFRKKNRKYFWFVRLQRKLLL